MTARNAVLQFDHGGSGLQDGRQNLMTAGEVAEALGVSSQTVRRLDRRGELPRVQIGRSTRYRPEDVACLIQQKLSIRDEDPTGRQGLVENPAGRDQQGSRAAWRRHHPVARGDTK